MGLRSRRAPRVRTSAPWKAIDLHVSDQRMHVHLRLQLHGNEAFAAKTIASDYSGASVTAKPNAPAHFTNAVGRGRLAPFSQRFTVISETSNRADSHSCVTERWFLVALRVAVSR